MKKFLAILLTLVFMSMLLVGCGKSAEKDAPASQTEKQNSDVKIGVVFTQAGLGGNSFNDLVFDGVKKAADDMGVKYEYVEPKSVSDEEIIQDEMASSGEYSLIICVGFEQVDALKKVAAKYPDQKFAIIDARVDLPNVASYLSKEEEASFLVGALSAYAKNEKVSDKFGDSKTIGFIGGVDSPLIRKFAAGYTAGAKYVDKDYNVLVDYVGGFNDPSTAKVIANTFKEKGADLIFHAAGASGMGLFQAAKEGNFIVIGVNLNQNSIEPDYIMASMLKKVDESAYQVIKAVVDGSFAAGSKVLGVAEEGVDYTVEKSNIKVSDDIIKKVDELKAKIASGEIVIPEKLEDVDAFIANKK